MKTQITDKDLKEWMAEQAKKGGYGNNVNYWYNVAEGEEPEWSNFGMLRFAQWCINKYN